MIDIHMHIIPDVDDGAVSFEMACEMLESAYSQGVRGIIATPHANAFIYSFDMVEDRFRRLSLYAAQKHPDLRLSLGSEVYLDAAYADNAIRLLEKGCFPTMCGSCFVLSEFSPKVSAENMRICLKKLISNGRRPIIAHAERCPDALEDDSLVSELLHMGCLIQVNAYSLSGESNERIRTLARTLLARRQIHFLGSDAHRMTHRPPNVANGIRYIREHCPADYAEALLHGNAERMLMGDLEQDRFTGGMLGLAVGDALGVPYEFTPREAMKTEPATDMIGFGAHYQPKGTWSDDTSMALCCADSLVKGFDEHDIMKKFADWLYNARYTAGGVVFDSGTATRRAIAKFDCGYDACLCGGKGVDSNGNGSLMRTLPVSLWRLMSKRSCVLSDEELLRPVHAVSALTHAHERSQIACGIYTLFIDEWTRRTEGDSLLTIASRAYERAVRVYRGMGGTFAEEIDAPDRFVHPRTIAAWKEGDVSSGGYVLDTLHAALWCLLTTTDYASCVLKSVNLGRDTDTTAAVAGSLAGMIYGTASIPKTWLDTLQNRALIENITLRLYNSLSGNPQSGSIDSFVKEHAHLALKRSCSITIDSLTYTNAQAAWLAQSIPEDKRDAFCELNAHQARRIVKQLPVLDGWEDRKFDVLYEVCRAKYDQNPDLRKQLLATQDREIIYDTTGAHDNELGRCACPTCAAAEHKNLLGRILMRIRSELRG